MPVIAENKKMVELSAYESRAVTTVAGPWKVIAWR
jgi:hypothetical protein